MNDHTTRLSPELKVNLCECGCGQPTSLARQTDRRRGHIKGQPTRFVSGHNSFKPRLIDYECVLPPNAKAIPLTQGKFAIVDAADWEKLSQYRWSAREDNNTFYALRSDRSHPDGKKRSVLMHRQVVGSAPGEQVDHIDGNGLNNTRANLRRCTNQENCFNQRVASSSSSSYKGVTYFKRTGKWAARIRVGDNRKFLGYYDDPIDAARAYDKAAIELHGEFSRTNFEENSQWTY